MYVKPAMTCFRYKMCMGCSETITHMNVYFEWFQSQHYESSNSPHLPL